jgi:hypothetical protein
MKITSPPPPYIADAILYEHYSRKQKRNGEKQEKDTSKTGRYA